MQTHGTFGKYFQPSDIQRGPYPARMEEFYQAGLHDRAAHRIKPASEDAVRIAVILVDYQYDFVYPKGGQFPAGSLAVDGAQADVNRFLQWFYAHADRITSIYASLDTHLPHHIFFSDWWVNGAGKHPDSYTVITAQDVADGKWKPTREPEWSERYVRLLEETHHRALIEGQKRELIIWPYHTLEGTLGHMLVPPISEAIAWHSAARDAQPTFVAKGRTMRTEYYGLFGAEIPDPEDPQSDMNVTLLDAVMQHDLVYIAGEAASHCVMESEKQIIVRFGSQKKLMQRLNFLTDCTSPINRGTFPQDVIKWEARAKEGGVQLVKSTDPLPV